MLSKVWTRLRHSTLASMLLILVFFGSVAAVVLFSINNTATVSGPILQAQSVPSGTLTCPSAGYASSLSLTWGTVAPSSVNSQLVCLLNSGNASYTLSGCSISPSTGNGTVACSPATGTVLPGTTQLVTVTWTAPSSAAGTISFQITFS